MAVRRTPRADQDLVGIYLEGVGQFGQRQAEIYAANLSSCFELLASQPLMARERTEIQPPVRVHAHGSHIIVYAVDEEDILIMRVLHGRRDWEREFQ
ncbi:type II toxin-antitoxin system RelE/ParE family toxin [Bosea vaviloviae]|uniref:Toxin n=1 Tax=Bosea vaviloviae TaxID=1526658 RepID=A0A1D7TY91_9HYPH|nr:type II toxin-antitoxin system RelE/ParE family toxin [Bosea vaviloviae]AOO80098.1 plasmid stabilization protein ParE [Bosea vaviloviae]